MRVSKLVKLTALKKVVWMVVMMVDLKVYWMAHWRVACLDSLLVTKKGWQLVDLMETMLVLQKVVLTDAMMAGQSAWTVVAQLAAYLDD